MDNVPQRFRAIGVVIPHLAVYSFSDTIDQPVGSHYAAPDQNPSRCSNSQDMGTQVAKVVSLQDPGGVVLAQVLGSGVPARGYCGRRGESFQTVLVAWAAAGKVVSHGARHKNMSHFRVSGLSVEFARGHERAANAGTYGDIGHCLGILCAAEPGLSHGRDPDVCLDADGHLQSVLEQTFQSGVTPSSFWGIKNRTIPGVPWRNDDGPERTDTEVRNRRMGRKKGPYIRQGADRVPRRDGLFGHSVHRCASDRAAESCSASFDGTDIFSHAGHDNLEFKLREQTRHMKEHPNVLFIIADQQRADHVGFMGNEVVQTPNVDALAAQGTVFRNAWVNNPVCMPNRSTIMTGRMPSAHGVIFNDRTLDWGSNTFVRQFKAAGYRTGLIGKSHLQHGMSKNSVVPFRGRAAYASSLQPGWDQVEDFERYLDGVPEMVEDFYGFGHVELSIDHGARATGHHLQWALNKGARREDLLVDYSASAPGQHRSSHWWQIYQPPYDEEFHSTRFVTERTIDFIRDAQEAGAPWLAWCSFPDPHHPMTPPGKWFHRHRPEDMVLPDSRHDSLIDAPEHLRLYRDTHPRDQRNWVAPCGYGSDELLQGAIAATYGMVEMIDAGVGEITRCLDDLGVRDDTIIVYTSDHGDMMGDHGLFLKGFMHYRGTLQVPMVMSVPNKPAHESDNLSASIDLGPTLLELCDLPEFDGMQGHSLAPLLDDPHAVVRDCVLIEDDVAAITAKLTPIPGKTRSLIVKNARYTRNSKGEEQLFDLNADPDEMRDLKASAGALRAEMVERLMDALIEADDVARGAPATNQATV